MTRDAVLHDGARLGVKLSLEGSSLRVRAPAGAVTPELRAALTTHKAALLEYLAAPHDEIAPLLPAQRSLWLLHQGEPASRPAYNIRAARRFRGPLDARRLERALAAIVARHEPLRTSFYDRDGEPWQRIAPAVPVRIARTDVSDLTPEARETAWQARLAAEGGRAFDLRTAPLFAVELVRLSPEEHVLLLNAHHLIADAWSAGLLLRELATAYAALAAGSEVPASPAAFRFSDHVQAQRRAAGTDAGRAALEFWQQELAGLPALQLPADFTPATATGYAGASEAFVLDPALAGELRALARAEGVTLFHALISSFAVLLQRLSGQNDFGIGTTLAGRDTQEAEGLIGYCVNLVVLRQRFAAPMSFRELIRRTRAEALVAFQHQTAPFDQIVHALRLPRERGVTPLFRVLFLYLQAARDVASFAGLEVEALPVPSTTAKYDLSLQVEDQGERLTGLIEFNSARFAPATIRRMIATWQTLLRGLVAAPDAAVEQLPAVGEAEARRLRVDFNATATPVEFAGGIAAAFRAQARRTPEAAALVHEDRELTYAQLDAAADRFAARLRAAGVGPERLVGVCVGRSAEMVIALLAILKAGGGYLPLDPAYPAERLGFMLAEARPILLLTQKRLMAGLPPHAVPRLLVDGIAEAGGPTVTNIELVTEPTQVAYVIYTSGSTGRPKGVMVAHGTVMNFFAGMDAQLGPSPGVWLAMTSISFDISVLELFWTLTRGFKVVVQSDEPKAGAARAATIVGSARPVAEQFARHAPTHLQATPSRIKMLLLDPPVAAALRGLERLIVGAEALDPALAAELGARLGGEVHNLYGPTETTVWSTGQRIGRDDRVVRIGRPLANQQVYVLDRHLQLLPVGVTGELYIGGSGVTRGYLGRPDTTAERFIPDPFGPVAGGRLYRTGDLARWHDDGTLECLGRTDDQVKILGHRIEPGEVEAMLARHPAVRAGAITAPLGADGERRLVAYVVAGSQPTPKAAELRAWLRERLPEHMVPAAVVFLPALPLTPSGKVERRALPAPEAAAPRPENEFVAPRTPAERLVALIWAKLLARPLVGAHDNFFEVGGHSLLAMQMIARLRQETGIDLPLRSVFEAPTVAGVAARLAEQIPARAVEAPAGALVRVPRDGRPLPLSFGQRRIWFIEQLEPGRATYHMPAAIRLRGCCSPAALEASFSALVRRHEALRTRFPVRDGEPFHDVLPPDDCTFALATEDLREFPRAEREARARARAAEEAGAPLDLAGGPLLRARLLQLDDQEHLLVFVIHHIVSDGWTMGLITRELTALYAVQVANASEELPTLTAHYADFAAWQRERLSAEALRGPLAFWKNYLAGGVAAEIPGDRPRPRVLDGLGREYRFVWPADLTEGLHRVGQREGATLFMTLLTGYYALLARYTRQDDLVVGTSVANRPRPEFEAMAGFFVNLLPVRVDTSGNPTFVEMLARVKQACLAGFAHQDTPFEALIDAVAAGRDPSRTPIFQTMLVLLNAPQGTARLAGLEIAPVPLENRTAKFDVTLLGEEVGGELRWVAEYRTEIYSEATIARLAEHLRFLLAGAVASPDARLFALPLLAPAEVAALSAQNRTARSFPGGRWIHEYAAEAPDEATALIFAGRQLTYREFNARTDALAGLLIARGVGPESLVAVFLERSVELVVALHAILKAGGAYVPLDPGYPAERIAYMLADANVALVLTVDSLADQLPQTTAQVLHLDRLPAPGRAVKPPVLPGESAAYMIYTSGSTGRPKGAVNTHAGVLNRLQWMQAALPLAADDRVLQKTPYSFDVSVWEFFWPFMTGATLVVAEPQAHQDPVRLIELIVGERITTLHFVPSMLRAFLDTPGVERCVSLRQVICSGEELPRELARRCQGKLPAAALHNLYGPTEAAVDVSWHACAADADGPVPIGRPIANLEIHVLDPELQPVPVGIAGEIYLGGIGLGRGYHRQPALTAERWVPHPQATEPGARLYRTGDLGRWRADGEVEYLGRVDFQVKLRGFRIELGEIAAALREHSQVTDAVCALRTDSPAGARLVGYVVARTTPPTVAELRAWLGGRLPDYMVPTAWVFLAALPLSPAGKVDRRALPVPLADRPTERIAPRNADEAAVAAIWSEVLGREGIGATDDFFELGGHSLIATQVMTRLRERCGIALPLRVLFEQTTVETLAAAIRAAQATAAPVAPVVELRRARRERRRVLVQADGEIGAVELAREDS